MIKTLTSLMLAVLPFSATNWQGEQPAATGSTQSSATSGALAAAMQFHAALARGDSAAAEQLLESDAMILESGDIETRAEYLAHHLGEDMEFARAVASKRTIVRARRDGSVVWIVASSTSQGRFGDRNINSRGAELMLLGRSRGEWRIRAIHWSSRRKSTSP